jgi:hypothetical protein
MSENNKSLNLFQLLHNLKLYKNFILLTSTLMALIGIFYSFSKPVVYSGHYYIELAKFTHSQDQYLNTTNLKSSLKLFSKFKSFNQISAIELFNREDYPNFLELQLTCLNVSCRDSSDKIMKIIKDEHFSGYLKNKNKKEFSLSNLNKKNKLMKQQLQTNSLNAQNQTNSLNEQNHTNYLNEEIYSNLNNINILEKDLSLKYIEPPEIYEYSKYSIHSRNIILHAIGAFFAGLFISTLISLFYIFLKLEENLARANNN